MEAAIIAGIGYERAALSDLLATMEAAGIVAEFWEPGEPLTAFGG